MAQHLKFCTHVGAGGIGYPKENLIELNQAGIAFGAKHTDTMPYDAQEIARQFPEIDNVVVFRRSVKTPTSGNAPSGNPDVPQYDLPPQEAARNHWAWHRENLPPELDPEITWVETINEVAQEFVFGTTKEEEEKARAVPRYNLRTIYQRDDDHWVVTNGEWLAEFAIETAVIMMADGYKWAAFGWGPGEPETKVWHGDRMVDFLLMVSRFPDKLAIALHEYSQRVDDIWAGNGWLVGRFLHLFGACDDNNIPRVPVFITEWGWTLWDVPPWEQAESDYLEVGELLAQHKEVKLAAIWALNTGWRGIADKLATHIEPLQRLTMNTEFPEPTDPNPSKTTEQKIFELSQGWAFSVNQDAALQKAGIADGFAVAGVEDWETVDGQKYAMQPFYKWDDTDIKRTYYTEVHDNVASNDVKWTNGEPSVPGAIPVPMYWQRDPRWADHPCGFGPRTIAQWGCLLCAYNMLGEFWGLTDGRKPNDENEYYKARGGFDGEYLVSMAMAKVYGRVTSDGWMSNSTAMHQKAKQYLAAGVPVPARVDFVPETSQWEQHWVLLVGYDPSRGYLMNDPWTGKTAVPVSDYYDIAGDDIIQCLFYQLSDPPIEPPPSGQKVATYPYFSPPEGQTHGEQVVFHFDDGRTQPQQLERLANGRIILWKGEGQTFDNQPKIYFDYEEWFLADGIRKLWDTSSGGKKAYNLGGIIWLPPEVIVGHVYPSYPTVREVDRTTCAPLAENETADYIYVRALLPLWTSPKNLTIQYLDVLVLEWRKSPDLSAKVEETYWLARGVSYVAWQDGAVGERPLGRTPLSGELTACI